MIANLLKNIDSMSNSRRLELFEMALPIIEHNYNHFYNGGFEQILWNELISMLTDISRDFEI